MAARAQAVARLSTSGAWGGRGPPSVTSDLGPGEPHVTDTAVEGRRAPGAGGRPTRAAAVPGRCPDGPRLRRRAGPRDHRCAYRSRIGKDRPAPATGSPRWTWAVEAAAVATTAAFAGAALLSQTVVVPAWRSLPPAEFLHRFAQDGPATGATAFPFELAATVLLAFSAREAFRRRRAGRGAWLLATTGMVGSLLLLAYFVPADLALLDPAFPPAAVPAALAVWSGWNAVRTALGLASAVLACCGLAARPGAPGALSDR